MGYPRLQPKEHIGTHGQRLRQDGEPLDFNDDELEGEDEHLHSLGEESPESGNDYLSGLPQIPTSISDIPGPLAMSMAPPQHHLIAANNY